jgi:dipeptidyl aminopeptidase/acylaminoacyl peptidase
MKNISFIFVCLLTNLVFSQKKIIDHTVYNSWKTKSDVNISNNGKFTSYVIKPHKGDGFLYLVNNETGKKDSIFRANMPRFTADSKVLLFKITPGFDTLRNCELNKVKKDKWPKDSLGVWFLANDSLVKFPKMKEFVVSEEGSTFAFLSHENKSPLDVIKGKKKKKWFKKAKVVEEIKSDGNLLSVFNTDGNSKSYLKNVTDYVLSENGEKLAFITHQKIKADSSRIWLLDLTLKKDYDLSEKFISIQHAQFDKTGNKLIYLASQDTAKDTKVYQLHHFDLNSNKKSLLVGTLNGDYALTKSVSHHLAPYFSLDGTKVFFGIADIPKVAPKDSLLESEKAKLDLWHWKDDRLQPQQLLELSRDEKDTWLSVFDLNTSSLTIIENDSIELRHSAKNPSAFVLSYNEKPYNSRYNWEYPNKRDVYLTNVFSGEHKLIFKADAYGIQLSPSGKYAVYFNEKDQQQYVKNLESDVSTCISCNEKAEWLDDVNGMPIQATPFRGIEWMPNEESFLIKSKYDIYKFDIASKKLSSFINKDAEKEKIQYSILSWDYDSLYFSSENNFVKAFYENDKSEAFFKINSIDNQVNLVEIHRSNHALKGFLKAKNADLIHFQKHSLKDYAESYITTFSKPSEIKCISNTNPQQVEYNWATVDLVSWKSYDGIALKGLLYKPEDFDSTKKYPLLVYFYEMYSDELHNHYMPKPTASIIHPTEYASAGYIVLIPDIRYKAGYPARGAYDCIMSGTDYVVRNFSYVDSTRMGLQGQSWGGYQTAQLITMTKRYKAAMAGAPVGNMFSAYGGIRWGSGLNRQFQYEKTQSRIGKTIWEAPELYVENSPLFHLPKVEIPLLIMHNDADGAVPWYQGIELFTALKRLDKPVWMLNYNGDDHNLMKNANRFDLSIRMRQFFDHYLLNKPAPVWLTDGLPAIKKGKEYGLDYK